MRSKQQADAVIEDSCPRCLGLLYEIHRESAQLYPKLSSKAQANLNAKILLFKREELQMRLLRKTVAN